MDRDSINLIEDEPYEGFFKRGKGSAFFPRANVDDTRLQLADMLRDRREALGLTLDEVAETTRVRRAYLEAFEQAAYDVLPPRAFAIGYVKAYARALSLDEEVLADMFKREMGDPSTRLQAPTGASMDDVKPNYRPVTIAATCLLVAIVVWNVVQRKPLGGLHASEAQMTDAAWPGQDLIHEGIVFTSQKRQAPKDQDIPALYYTPGLEEGFAALEAERHGGRIQTTGPTGVQLRKAFNPRGAIYGAPPEQSVVTLQARKSVDLIVRKADGTVAFAQYLNAGESYRVPVGAAAEGLTVVVSDFTSLEVYYAGEFAGGLDALQMPAQRINMKAEATARTLDATADTAPTTAAAPVIVNAAPERPTLSGPQGPILYGPAQRPATPRPATSASASGSESATSPSAASSESSPAAAPPSQTANSPAAEPAETTPQ